MYNKETYERTRVNEPFTRIQQEEINEDPVLFAFVERIDPEVVIGLPQFPELVYLRTQQCILAGFGISRRVTQEEKGFYYDRAAQALVDLEKREDGKIMPTSFAFSTKMLLYRRHGIGPFYKE
jgi:hypothetical protein